MTSRAAASEGGGLPGLERARCTRSGFFVPAWVCTLCVSNLTSESLMPSKAAAAATPNGPSSLWTAARKSATFGPVAPRIAPRYDEVGNGCFHSAVTKSRRSAYGPIFVIGQASWNVRVAAQSCRSSNHGKRNFPTVTVPIYVAAGAPFSGKSGHHCPREILLMRNSV